MPNPLNAYIDQSNAEPIMVWFGGSTALYKGMGVCYNSDYGTAATREPSRRNRVELPSTSNNQHFAGVAAHNYSAVTGGQMIEIYPPGSVCDVYLYGPSVTVNSGRVTCQAGGTYAGYFTRTGGFAGEGSAVPLQTIDGASGDTCLALLETGEPSGLVEVVSPEATGGANSFLVGGVSYIEAATLTGDVTDTLADGVLEGQRKKFEIEGDMGNSQDVVITVTSGIQNDGSDTTLASLTGDDDGDIVVLEWVGDTWREVYTTGWSIASS